MKRSYLNFIMTAQQYYFPYLFSLEAFNTTLASFGLHAHIACEKETQLPEWLYITRQHATKALISLSFGTHLMIDQHRLVHWQTDTDLLDITEVELADIPDDPWVSNQKIYLSALHPDKNELNHQLETRLLITYVRMEKIIYRQDNFDRYAIIIISKKQVNIIPFDWFNTRHSEYDYIWPATARLNLANGKLHGRGIRMPDFCIEIDKILFQ